ncbi:MAG: type I restriction endonuclease subunit R [Calditrichaceae bacterium]|nr:type I restriction endonuclease subunit R [Calditrichaceae bacterium]RQV93864.1 MAG: type I restriction endonuclease subunit R [Calditrichota bacterium]
MNNLHTESTFESAIIEGLIANNWFEGKAENFNNELALDTNAVLEFIKTSQPSEWESLKSYYRDETESKFIQRLSKELDLRGMLDVIRHGITDSGIKFRLAYFKPDSGLNPDTLKLYNFNRHYVTRQVHYSSKNKKSIDLVISLNGLPVATIELKNHFTGQRVSDAIEQYKTSRDPKEILFQFKKRAIVHFTVDPDEVYFTTKLESGGTRFFPFNKGYNDGAGNPPAKDYTTYRSAYFWEDILAIDSWTEIIGRYIHLHKEEYTVEGRKYYKETMLFPRFHQLDVVRQLIAHAKESGSGQRYLIEHSAGSGKSNSIAWLAYRLSSLYDSFDKKIFDSIIVITDRNVLDQQLQNTIYQFEHKTGVVQRIDVDSQQLAEAITKGDPIIITTLQKFPFALNHLTEVPNKKYAVIIDEARSSQGGEASRKMTEALVGKNVSLEESEKVEGEIEAGVLDEDDYVREVIQKRGPQKNISLFAFTATPKPKTLEVFGKKDGEGKPQPFHLYSMRQAIEEGFILDVLKNYTTYETYYRFNKTIEDDPLLNKKKAVRAIGRFASLHPTNLAQKTEVMVEHFRQITMKKIGGKAKAMVVTASRKHALKFYLEFKEYIKEKGYKGIRPLVAFSGSLTDDLYPDGITEAQLNKFGEKELPEKFNTTEYQVLLVADKYQYGFDQPLLHTMYVDKKLSGVKAVQTLSRLNRTYPGKEDTFVLDFANDRQTIIDSFQPYYEMTMMSESTDPNHLYDLKGKTDSAQVYFQSEIDTFSKVFYKPGSASVRDQGKLYAYIDPAVDRYKAMDEEHQDDFKKSLTAFVRLYSFLSQVMPFQDVDLEKLYSFGRYLLTKLPKADYTERLKLDNEVALEYYRLQKIAEGDLVLQVQGKHELDPPTEAGISRDKEEKDKLSNIIALLNEKYNFDFTDQDRLYFEQIEQALYENDELKIRAKNNPIENFKYAFDEIFIQTLIDRMDANQEIFDKIMVNSEFKDDVKNWLTKKIYQRFKEE